MSIALEKFGLRLYLGEGAHAGQDAAPGSAEVGRTVVAKLSAAARCLERHVLTVLGAEQVAAGRLTVHNQAASLRHMYEYFRRLATDAPTRAMAFSLATTTSAAKEHHS